MAQANPVQPDDKFQFYASLWSRDGMFAKAPAPCSSLVDGILDAVYLWESLFSRISRKRDGLFSVVFDEGGFSRRAFRAPSLTRLY
jgi:hypothetical protein